MSSCKDSASLSLDSLGELLEELYDVNIKWYTVGLRLKLKTSTLDKIKSHSSDSVECLREMLKEWLKSCEDCTWSVLVGALRSRSVGEYALAKRLEEERSSHSERGESGATPKPCHLSSEEKSSSITSDDVFVSLKGKFDTYIELPPSELPSPTTSDRETSSSEATSNATNADRHAAYGCGCGKCSLNSFLDGHCPDPEKAATSFPYIKVSSLTESEKMFLKGRLFEDFCQISIEFSKFNTAICESLIHRKIPVLRVTRILRDLRAFPPSDSSTPLLGEHIDKITLDHTIDDVFNVLSHYISFFNFQITEHIVDSLGTDHDKVLLCIYKKKLDNYCNRNIFECPTYSTPHPQQTALVMKVEGIEQYNIKHLSKLISHVSRALSIANYTPRLCNVEEGCVKLIFQIPSFVKDAIFPLTAECIKRLMYLQKSMNEPVQITMVKCGFFIYKIPALLGQSMKEKVVVEKGCQYNHGYLSRTDAESLLTSVNYNCFLVRQSSNAPGCFIYSYKDYGYFNHVKKQGEIDHDFIHATTKQSVCLMPIHLEDIVISQAERDYRPLSDYESDSENDFTGDTTGDFTGTEDFTGTGDSAVILRSALPTTKTPKPPPTTEEDGYAKINPRSLEKTSMYCKLDTKIDSSHQV